MHSSWGKIVIASPDAKVGDARFNCENIIKSANEADKSGACVVVFSELALSGASCGDLFSMNALIDSCEDCLTEIVDASKSIAPILIVGTPLYIKSKLYNCAAVIHNGRLAAIVPKTNSSIHFSSGAEIDGLSVRILDSEVISSTRSLIRSPKKNGIAFSVAFASGLSLPDPAFDSLSSSQTPLLICLGASSEFADSFKKRRTLTTAHSMKYSAAVVLSQNGRGESTTDSVYSSHSLIVSAEEILAERDAFSREPISACIDFAALGYTKNRERKIYSTVNEIYIDVLDNDTQKTIGFTAQSSIQDENCIVPSGASCQNNSISKLPEDAAISKPFGNIIKSPETLEHILDIQAHALLRRMDHVNTNKAVIGISGGLDSTLALLVVVRAFELSMRPVSDIVCVNMPSFGSSKRTKGNSAVLCSSLGIECRIIDITDSVKQHFIDISHDENVHDAAYENAQARERTQVLMDIANMVNGFVVGTGNLSEQALGWSTYNGDHMSMYSVNAGLPKTLLSAVVSHAAVSTSNSVLKKTLFDILDTPISPELLPASKDGAIQSTENTVGPYELHDFFIYYGVFCSYSPTRLMQISAHAFKGKYTTEEIKKWMRVFFKRFFANQFKRSCMPDGVNVLGISFSPRNGFLFPSDASASAWLDEIDKIEL